MYLTRCQQHSISTCGNLTFSEVPVLSYFKGDRFMNRKPVDVAMIRYKALLSPLGLFPKMIVVIGFSPDRLLWSSIALVSYGFKFKSELDVKTNITHGWGTEVAFMLPTQMARDRFYQQIEDTAKRVLELVEPILALVWILIFEVILLEITASKSPDIWFFYLRSHCKLSWA